MLRVALSTSSSGSSGDENADEQPRCPAPRWRLDPGDASGLEASALVGVMSFKASPKVVPVILLQDFSLHQTGGFSYQLRGNVAGVTHS